MPSGKGARASAGRRKGNWWPGFVYKAMQDPNLLQLEAAARLLRPVLGELVFVGGSITGLLITEPGSGAVRPTLDIDAISKVASYAEYARLSERLRALGLREDDREGAPTCRWRAGDLVIDIMPTDPRILGFSNRWYAPALSAAEQVVVAGLPVVRRRLEQLAAM
jgi:hypothetical protein